MVITQPPLMPKFVTGSSGIDLIVPTMTIHATNTHPYQAYTFKSSINFYMLLTLLYCTVCSLYDK